VVLRSTELDHEEGNDFEGRKGRTEVEVGERSCSLHGRRESQEGGKREPER